MITVVDYGMGNLGSIRNMFKRIGIETEITSDLKKISRAKKILLPGVGKFDAAMERINGGGLRSILDQKALEEKVPILGICLGMQLLTKSSEEGTAEGLGWIDAVTKKIPSSGGLKVPHMGWNVVYPSKKSCLTESLVEDSRFYFVHSYCVHVANQDNSILKTTYGIEFDSAVQKNNIYGAQFHPEKSHKFGMSMLRSFGSI